VPHACCRDFILSVAAAEEEERRRTEEEAEAARAGQRSLASSRGGPGGGGTQLPSHASFLASLDQEERRVIGESRAKDL
jgi:hypothetical protein